MLPEGKKGGGRPPSQEFFATGVVQVFYVKAQKPLEKVLTKKFTDFSVDLVASPVILPWAALHDRFPQWPGKAWSQRRDGKDFPSPCVAPEYSKTERFGKFNNCVYCAFNDTL